MRISPFLAKNNKNQVNMPAKATEQTCPEKVGAKKSNKIQLHQQTVQQLFFMQPSTTMCKMKTLQTHAE